MSSADGSTGHLRCSAKRRVYLPTYFWMHHGHRAVPDWAMALWKSPIDSLMLRNVASK